MSARISEQTMAMAVRISNTLLLKHKGLLHKDELVELIAKQVSAVPTSQILDPRHIGEILATAIFRQHTLRRRKWEREAERSQLCLFRPELLVPTGTGILSRLGTGQVMTLLDLQKQLRKGVRGAQRIITAWEKWGEYSESRIPELIKRPEYNLEMVETDIFGYKRGADDGTRFTINPDINWDADIDPDDSDDE